MKLIVLILLALCLGATTDLPPLPSDVVDKPVLQSPKASSELQNAQMVRASTVVIPPTTPIELRFKIPTNVCSVYFIQQSTDLKNWTTFAGPFGPPSGITNFMTVTNRGEAQRFFRIFGQ